VAEGQVETQPSVEDLAATVAAGILSDEEEAPKEAPKEPEAEAQPAEETEEEAKTEEQTEADTEEPSQPRKHKLTVKAEDGADVEVEVDDDELKKGYMLEKSYRQKTAQIARERESVNQKIKEAIEPKLKEYDDKLQLAEQAIWHSLAPEIQGIDWNKLAAENPAEWAQKYQMVQNVNSRLSHIQSERQKVAEERGKEQQSNMKKQAEESVEILRTEIPGWNNDLYGKILKAGVENGLKPEEVNAITDHRAIKLLWKAMQYDAIKAKPIVENRAAVKAPKVAKPGTTEKPDASADRWTKSMARLQESGKEKDAFQIARMLLEREAK